MSGECRDREAIEADLTSYAKYRAGWKDARRKLARDVGPLLQRLDRDLEEIEDLATELCDERTEHQQTINERDALRSRVFQLEGALERAIGDIEEWAAYADAYFREKWDLAGCLAWHREVLAGAKAERPGT